MESIILWAILGFAALCLTFGILVLFKSSQKGDEKIDEQMLEIVKENGILRNKVVFAEKKLQSYSSIAAIDITTLDIIREKNYYEHFHLKSLDEIGIKETFIFQIDRDSKQIVPIINTQSDASRKICEVLSFDKGLLDKLPISKVVTPQALYLINNEVYNRLITTIGSTQFSIAYMHVEKNEIGIFFAVFDDTIYLDEAAIKEISSIFSTSIAHRIYNIRLFNALEIERQRLEQQNKIHQQELEVSLERLRQIGKAKTEFISAVSHEIRTSLTSIKGFSNLIVQGALGEVPESIREKVAKIEHHADNLITMVNTMLDINKIESQKIEMNKVQTNLRKMCEQAVDQFLPQILEKQLKVEVEMPDALQAFVDNVYFARVLSNLISNAIKFTPQGGAIFISATEENETLTLKIKDTGIGINEQHLPHIFDEFYHIESPETTTIKGIGLGLSLAKRVVLAHNGQIWADSKKGKGTTFFIQIPKGK